MAKKIVGNYAVEIAADMEGLKNDLGAVPKLIGAAFAADALVDFTKKVVAVQAEFQRYEAVLSNTLGSTLKAEVALKDLTKTAATTPFQINTLTEAYVKLANQGFVPTQKEIIKLGDLASSTGKDFLQLTEAIIDAQVGEFERLKEFGIRAQKEGDKVTFTFKGLQTQVDNTEDSIREYILSLGEAEGVTGAMAKISETTGGKLSNLEDNFTGLFKAIGDSDSGLIAGVLDLANAMVGELVDSINAVNTVAEKTGKNGFQSFLDQISALVNPAYGATLKAQAAAFDLIDRQAAAASETTEKQTAAEKKQAEELKKALEERAKKSRDFYEETLKFSQDYAGALQVELDTFFSYVNVTERFTKRIQEAMKPKEGPQIQDFEINIGDGAPVKETADIFVEESNKINEAFTEMLLNTNTLENAFAGLGNAIISNMEGGSTALKAFLTTFVSAAGQYIAASLKMQAVDKKKAAGKMVNIAANTAEAAGPFAAIVFPAILSGLLALISGVFGGGVGGSGGGGAARSTPTPSTLTGSQATESLRDSLKLTGELEVKNGGKLSVFVKNQELKKSKT